MLPSQLTIPWDLKKVFYSLIKMTLTEELKILDDKIKVNQAQHDLDREATRMFALWLKKLDKYEYLMKI